MAFGPIKKLYIANRAEIALRIKRTADTLGIACVLGVSEADKEQSFAGEFEEKVVIGPPPAALSYLAVNAVIDAALKSGCDAVHPGYGFLSENYLFAEAVIKNGLRWVGPSAESIRLMGSKIEGRLRAKEAKVPTVPGTRGGLSDLELVKESQKIGFPLIVKAVGGGGGRGMRVVRTLEELKELLPRARGEALKNFSSDDVFLERFLERPRHVEVQLLGDMAGTVVHLGTRDCSAQRRHQKLVEEAPAPFLRKEVRSKIERAAVAVAKTVGYYSTGTAEFLVEGDQFYFLEMNTRIQVEHPVTEMISGLDLIAEQIRVAEGKKLSFKQSQVRLKGHAIEFRINAEDPTQNFAPSTGDIVDIEIPETMKGASVRIDLGLRQGDVVTPFYDGLIGKIIVYAETRSAALRASCQLLRLVRYRGPAINLDFHRWLLRTKIFNTEGIDIAFVGREFGVECLEDLAAAEAIDPQSERFISNESYHSVMYLRVKDNRGKDRQIEVVFDTENFVCREVGAGAGRGKKRQKEAVASNSLKAAVDQLLEAIS